MTFWVSMRKKPFIRFALFVTLLYIVFLTVKPLLRPGYYPMHDDIQPIRLLQMDKCIKDFQIPCRWVPDMGYGFGYPQFNYYAPLPYYVMEAFHLSGFTILGSIKVYLVLITALSVWGIYKLSQKFWQSDLSGFIAAIFYTLLPYRAVNLYVRGAVGEYTAQALIPIVLLFSYSLLKEKKKIHILYFALSLAFLWLSHTISAVIFTPFLIAFMLYVYLKLKKVDTLILIKRISLSLLGFITLIAFFIFPALLERNLIHMDTLTSNYFDFRGHFLGIYQILFSNNWGYGSSIPGANDQIMLGIGVIYWLLPITALLISFLEKKDRLSLIFLNVLAWFSLFMVHPKSLLIWKSIPFLNYVQFPWRFNAIAGLFFCLSVGYFAVLNVSVYVKKLFLLFITAILLIFYGSFFRPSEWLNITDKQKLSGENWQKAITISINDYLPIYTSLSPPHQAAELPVVLSGKIDFINIEKGSDWQRWLVDVLDDSRVQAQIFYFPDWKVYVDQMDTKIDYLKNGLITFDLTKGKHTVILKLTDTPIRVISNVLTLMGFFIFLLLYRKYNYEN